MGSKLGLFRRSRHPKASRSYRPMRYRATFRRRESHLINRRIVGLDRFEFDKTFRFPEHQRAIFRACDERRRIRREGHRPHPPLGFVECGELTARFQVMNQDPPVVGAAGDPFSIGRNCDGPDVGSVARIAANQRAILQDSTSSLRRGEIAGFDPRRWRASVCPGQTREK